MKFPVVIVKGDFKYEVESQDALDFHLAQGWKVMETAAEVVAQAKSGEAEELREQVAAFAGIVADMEAKIARLEQGMELLSSISSDHAVHLDNLIERVGVLDDPTPPAPPVEPPAPPVEPPAPPVE